MPLILFDLDDTLLSGDTEREWAEHMLDLPLDIEEGFLEKLDSFTALYREGNLDINIYTSFLLKPIKNLREEELKDLAFPFCERTFNKFKDQTTLELLNKHKKDTCLLVSGTLSFLVKEMASLMGLDDSLGTPVEIENGILTGKRGGPPNFSEEKVNRVREWIKLDKGNYEEIYAYSDSIYDLPMLDYADHPAAVSPDRKLRKIANERGWEIIERS